MTRTRTAKKTGSKNTGRKRQPGAPKTPALSLVPPRAPLPTRNRPFMTDVQGHATLAARIVGILTPHIRAWTDHGDHTASRPLQDGTLHYNQKTRTLTWQATCRMGAIHTYALDSPSTAAAARVQAARCTELHADLTKVQALTIDELEALGLLQTPTWARNDLLGGAITQTIPVPLPDRQPRALGDQLAHSGSSTDDTHPLSLGDIAEGLAARAQDADTEQPKEHPDHA